MSQETEGFTINLGDVETAECFSKLQTLLYRGYSPSYDALKKEINQARGSNNRLEHGFPPHVSNLVSSFCSYYQELQDKDQEPGEITFQTLHLLMIKRNRKEKPLSEKLIAFRNAYVEFEEIIFPYWRCFYKKRPISKLSRNHADSPT